MQIPPTTSKTDGQGAGAQALSSTGTEDWLKRALDHAAHFLPAQAQLEVFVHHNTLHAFQHLPFHEAVAGAEAKLGARGYLTEEAYRKAFAAGRISSADLDASLEENLPAPLPAMPAGLPCARDLARLALLHDLRPLTPSGLAWRLAEHGAAVNFYQEISASAAARLRDEAVGWASRGAEGCGDGPPEWLFTDPGGGDRAVTLALGDSSWNHSWRERGPEELAAASLWQACRWLVAEGAARPRGDEPLPWYPRDALLAVGAEDPNDLVHPSLVLFCGAFLDRGQSRWPMPERERGLFVAWRRVLAAGTAVRPSWLSGLGEQIRRWEAADTSSADAVGELLDELGVRAGDRPAFVERCLLQLPGWAGMFRRLEAAPAPAGRAGGEARLVDFLAVRLALDVFALRDVSARLGFRGPLSALAADLARRPRLSTPAAPGDHDRTWPLFLLCQLAGVPAGALLRAGQPAARAMLDLLGRVDRAVRVRIWQEAYERHYRDQLLTALAANRRAPAPPPPAALQIVFCMDDRSESIRRHFEELSDAHETFGTAGFFNLAIAYRGIDDPSTFPLCPVVVEPRHRIEEHPLAGHAHLLDARLRRRRTIGAATGAFHRGSRSLLWGPLVAAVAGVFSAVPLLASVFFPRLAGKLRAEAVRRLLPSPRTHLTLPRAIGGPREQAREQEREPGDAGEAGALLDGFALDEKAARVGALLENIGLVRGFAPIVVIMGHHSTSVNNPHFAAYSCGACGGRSGGPNARLFARMANRHDVRERLRLRGIDIPASTVFVGGVHDTCTDSVVLHDVDDLDERLRLDRRDERDGHERREQPAIRPEDLAVLQRALEESRLRDAHERARRFASAPRGATARSALQHVEGRATDLSQARPELGHATNAACVVGRRSLTRGLFLDRRSFLVSYDPSIDPAGEVLERTLLAVGPVGSGINLEYYFSTTDNEGLGAGTKLPHNVTGLVGVMNGAASDLRTGLPRQMIEIHEPVRLQMFIEATTEMLGAILARQPAVRELVENEWVRVVSIDPGTGAAQVYAAGRGFAPWRPEGAGQGEVAEVASSADWYAGHEGFLPPARVAPRASGARR
jgi:uncharacterized protein